MTPQTNQKLPPNQNTTTSKYWDTVADTEKSQSPPRKKRGVSLNPATHGCADATTTPPQVPPDLDLFKRSVADAFEFMGAVTTSVKEEPRCDECVPRASTLTRHFSATKTSQHSGAAKTTSPSPRTRETTQSSNVITSGPQQRSAIVATLVHVWDGSVTAAAVALVLRWARHFAPSAHRDIYDAAFIQAIIADLDSQGIEPQRRAVITTMLARPLQQQLENLRSSSESLRSCLESITTPQPSSALSKRPLE